MTIDTVVWEFEKDPDAEELLLQALEMFLPRPREQGLDDGPDKNEEPPLA